MARSYLGVIVLFFRARFHQSKVALARFQSFETMHFSTNDSWEVDDPGQCTIHYHRTPSFLPQMWALRRLESRVISPLSDAWIRLWFCPGSWVEDQCARLLVLVRFGGLTTLCISIKYTMISIINHRFTFVIWAICWNPLLMTPDHSRTRWSWLRQLNMKWSLLECREFDRLASALHSREIEPRYIGLRVRF